MYNKILQYKSQIIGFLGGVIGGLLFIYASTYIGSSNKFVDSYVPIAIVIVSFILFLVNRKWIGIGLLSSYPIFWVILIVLLGIACGQGSCL